MELRTDSYRPRHGHDAQTRATNELRANLVHFAPDGLTQLAEDLRAGVVIRGAWKDADGGCVISYRRGDAGSASSSAPGTAADRFIQLWDSRWLRAPAVLAEVEAEFARRVPEPREVPAPVEAADRVEETPCPAS